MRTSLVRLVTGLAVVAIALVAALSLTGGVAAAQPAERAPGAAPAPTAQPGTAPRGTAPRIQIVDGAAKPAAAPAAGTPAPRIEDPRARDVINSNGPAMAVLFWIFALGMIGGAIFVITRRNMIAAVMGMVGTFFAVAGLYMMLYASFLAVIQMLVYAGAIMVLFVFVIMILNRPEDEPWGLVGLPGKILAGIALAYLTFRLGSLLASVKAPADALLAPPPVVVPPGAPTDAPTLYDWGSTAGVGWNLFNEYLFPFEAVSILLLVAVVGAIAIARPLKADDDDAAEGDAAAGEAS